jgi:hypothetical protein
VYIVEEYGERAGKCLFVAASTEAALCAISNKLNRVFSSGITINYKEVQTSSRSGLVQTLGLEEREEILEVEVRYNSTPVESLLISKVEVVL